ncbi:MAG: lipoate--protein ligase family protein [Leptospirales bacterium]|nr:lipoate--protein ligase family protein [Leptospirales bacterium]
MNKFRLIVDPPLSGSVNMAKDHAILSAISHDGQSPALRIYRWIEPTVTIGYFEEINCKVDRDYCNKKKIPVIRRESGGGTVLHHMELTYSFTIRLNSGLIPQSVNESFQKIISPIINTLKEHIDGVEYRAVNDIVINERKISGSAQSRRSGVLQQHGTIIFDIDDEILASAIIHNEEKLKNRGFSSARQALTSMKDETGKDIDERFMEGFIASMISRFSKEFNVEFICSELSESESVMMEDYAKRFSSDEWNFKK